MKAFDLVVIVLISFFSAMWGIQYASDPMPLDEIDECRRLAPKYDAELEVRQWDGTRVDLVTAEYAIEVDWAPKWAEGIGQALYYAELTGLKPAVMLLVKDPDAERRYIYRCQTVCARYDIKLFLEEVEDDG